MYRIKGKREKRKEKRAVLGTGWSGLAVGGRVVKVAAVGVCRYGPFVALIM
jgi:hypothetical protein